MSKVTCEVCGSVVLESRFKEHEKAKKHQNALNGVKKHFCHECNKPLGNISSFGKHKREIHEGLIRYNYHCKTCNVYIKEKRDALTHRKSKKHLNVLKYLYHCDVCDKNVLLNKEGMIRAHKLIHKNKCNLKAVFYDEYKRTDITWVTNVKKIDGKKKNAAVVRRPVMFNKKTGTYEEINETEIKTRTKTKKQEVEKPKEIKNFKFHYQDFMDEELINGTLEKEEMDEVIKDLANFVEHNRIEITEDDYNGDLDDDLENLDMKDEDETQAILLELTETIDFVLILQGDETEEE
eukprot:gene8459-284_t